MFFDLSIPYLETLNNTDSSKSKILKLRLKTLARAMELGYTAVAYDRPFKGVISDADRCRIPRFSLTSLLEVAPTLPSAVTLHRDRNGVPRSVPFRQYSRVTVAVDRMSIGSAFNAKGVLRSYDLVAAKPLDQDAFDRVCQVSEVRIVLDL